MERQGSDLLFRAKLSHWLAGVMSGASPTEGWSGIWRASQEACCSDVIGRVDDQLAGPARSSESHPGLASNDGSGWVIESERVRLFETAMGGIPAPPYGSWWLDGRLMGPSAQRVAIHFEALGLTPTAGPPDHISSELEFLGVLLNQQEGARDVEAAEALRTMERDFIAECLAPWIDPFAQAARAATNDPFWTAVIALLAWFIRDESDRVASQSIPTLHGSSSL